MADAFADSLVRLERLLELVAKETDPTKRDSLAEQIRCVLDERRVLRSALTTQQPKQG